MDIKTKYGLGDEVYALQKTYATDPWNVIGPITVDKVNAEIAVFTRSEKYTCKETGLTDHALVDTFSSKEEAATEAMARNQKESRNV